MIQAQTSDALFKPSNVLQDTIKQSNPVVDEDNIEERATQYEKSGQYDKAVADYAALAKDFPDEEHLWYHLGYCQYKSGEYQAALRSLNRATKLNGQYLAAFHTKILVLLELNRNEAALRVSDSTLMIGETAMNYYLQGKVNERMNSRQKAEWAYSRATKMDKGFIDAYIAGANLAADMNKADETLVSAEAALGINPDSEAALLARSRGLALLGRYEDAIDDVSYIIERNPNNVDAYYWRANYYNGNKQPQQAIKDFNHVLEARPECWKALAERADCYVQIGDKKRALDDYRQLLVDAHNFPEQDVITTLANRQIFELNRESHAPQLVLASPNSGDFNIQLPDNQKTVTLQGTVTDESPIKSLVVNNKNVSVAASGSFETMVALDTARVIVIKATDAYDNVNLLTYHIVRNETTPPQIALFTPKATDSGVIILADDNNTLYVEGKITDDSTIAAIEVDGRAIGFEQNVNPVFSVIVDITNKRQFTISVTDQYGNAGQRTYTIEKPNATAHSDVRTSGDSGSIVEKVSK